jgi:hypothetical protein
MKYRPTKRVIWIVVPLLPVLIMSWAAWYAGKSEENDLATRGSKPPPARVFAKPVDWYDESRAAVMNWKLNPWKNQNANQFGAHFRGLRYFKNSENQAEYQKLMQLGKEWYERILARYPELAITYKNLPDEENGLLQWYLWEKRQDEAHPYPDSPFVSGRDLAVHFSPPKMRPWNPTAAQAWLDANRTVLNEARRIALMPDRSSRIAVEDSRTGLREFSQVCCRAFLVEARLFAEGGDVARALESMRAATGLVDHFSNGEVPTLREVSRGDHGENERYFFEKVLPALPPGKVDLRAWEKVLNPTLRQPADFASSVRGEWNVLMQAELLPILADSSAPDTPKDSEALAEAFTQYSKSLALQSDPLLLTDLPANPVTRHRYDNLTHRSQLVANNLGMTPESKDSRSQWEKRQVQTGMTQAAFAILTGKAIPNDPIRGLPYVWDPVARQLSPPDIPEYRISNLLRPFVLPKR